MQRGKRIRNAQNFVGQKSYILKNIVSFYCKEYKEKFQSRFDESVELNIILNKHVKQPQQISGMVKTGDVTGKNKKLVCFIEKNKQEIVKSYGADIVGAEELIDEIRKSKMMNFDICLSTSAMMPQVAKIAKKLGPKGLMPNPKLGTVLDSSDINENVISTLKTRCISFNANKNNVINCVVGKISIGSVCLENNIIAVIQKIIDFRTDKIGKHNFIKSIYVSSTHGPSLELDFVDILQ